MRTRPQLRSLLVLTIFASASLGQAAQPPLKLPDLPPAGPVEKNTLEARLMGTWVLKEATTPGNPSGIGIRQKIYTPGHWEMIQKDPKTGEVIFHHGGTYVLKGDVMEQKVEFAGAKTKGYIGKVTKFKITVEKDTYTQIAIGNQFNEVWKRADSA